jgi:hypothetical protein
MVASDLPFSKVIETEKKETIMGALLCSARIKGYGYWLETLPPRRLAFVR